MSREVPQPHPSRITPLAGHPIVVGVEPGQPELVALTAAQWAAASGATLYFAYVDPARVTEREFPDGTVQHSALDPDIADDTAWQTTETELRQAIATTLAAGSPAPPAWEFRYLAGRVDRSLTHLARAVDAAAIMVGTKASGASGRVHQFLQGSVATHLSSHQHRPVIVVPLSVVDWKTPLPRS